MVWNQKQALKGEVWGSEELGFKLRGGEKEEEAGGSETKSPSTGTCCCPVPISQMDKLSPKEFLTEETRNRDVVEWFSHSAMGTRACSQPVSKPGRTGAEREPGSILAFCHRGLLVSWVPAISPPQLLLSFKLPGPPLSLIQFLPVTGGSGEKASLSAPLKSFRLPLSNWKTSKPISLALEEL